MGDQLIAEVKKHPALYKRSSLDFKCKRTRELAWLSVSKVMKWTPQSCRLRWRSLRDRFVKELKLVREKGLTDAPVACKWQFFEQMQFIEGEVGTKRDRGEQSSCCNRYSMTEKILVCAVKNEKVLYDINHSLHHEKSEKRSAWNKVAKIVAKSPENCQKAWKKLRDRYVTNKSYKQCTHADIMDFLTDNMLIASDSEVEYTEDDDGIKDEITEEHLTDHSYTGDMQQQDRLAQGSFTVEDEDDDECTYNINEQNNPFTQVFIENDNVNEPTPSAAAPSTTRGHVLEAQAKFDKLIDTLNDFVKNQMAKETGKSRNHEFYRLVDKYIQKMPTDKQDKIKAEILLMVLRNFE